jgi:hypothetical protein
VPGAVPPALLIAAAGAGAFAALGDPRARPEAAVALMLAWGGLVLLAPAPRASLGPRAVFGAALLVRALLLGAPGLLSDDLYRYLWEGRAVMAGGDPYALPPADPAWGALGHDPHRALVNHPEVPAAYPPLALWMYGLLGRAAPDPLAVRALTAVADALSALMLADVLRRRRRPLWGAWMWALLPLAAVESAVGGHLDGIASCWLIFGLWSWERGGSGAAGVGLAGLLKLLPLALLPALARRRPWALAGVLGLGLLAAAPFAGSLAGGWAGLSTYAAHWRFQATGFAALEALLGGLARPAAGLIWLGLVLRKTASTADLAQVALTAGAGFLLLSPTVHPWYALWAWAPAVICGARAWALLAALMPLSYLALATLDPATGAWTEPAWTAPLTWGAFGLAWAAERGRGLLRPGPAAGA